MKFLYCYWLVFLNLKLQLEKLNSVSKVKRHSLKNLEVERLGDTLKLDILILLKN